MSFFRTEERHKAVRQLPATCLVLHAFPVALIHSAFSPFNRKFLALSRLLSHSLPLSLSLSRSLHSLSLSSTSPPTGEQTHLFVIIVFEHFRASLHMLISVLEQV